MTERVYYPQQGERINLYLLYCDGQLQSIYTHSVQAEAAQRVMQKHDRIAGDRCVYRIREMQTVPHDNNV